MPEFSPQQTFKIAEAFRLALKTLEAQRAINTDDLRCLADQITHLARGGCFDCELLASSAIMIAFHGGRCHSLHVDQFVHGRGRVH